MFLVKAKRYDYSFEPGIPFTSIGPEFLVSQEGDALVGEGGPVFVGSHPNDNTLSVGFSGNDQVYEDTFAGRLSGGENPESLPKQDNYDEYNADSFSKEEVFDMSANDTDVYGEYY